MKTTKQVLDKIIIGMPDDVSVCACGSTKYYIEQYKDVTKYYCSKCHEKIESKH